MNAYRIHGLSMFVLVLVLWTTLTGSANAENRKLGYLMCNQDGLHTNGVFVTEKEVTVFIYQFNSGEVVRPSKVRVKIINAEDKEILSDRVLSCKDKGDKGNELSITIPDKVKGLYAILISGKDKGVRSHCY